MALYTVEGIVVRVRNLGEADKVITLLSDDRGKVEAVARGARRPRNRLVGATQLFSYVTLQCFSSRSLDSISQAEIKESFRLLREQLEPMAYATYFAELTDRLVTDDDPHPGLVPLLLVALHLLQGGADPESVRRMYELKLLSLLGYRPQLAACAGCGGVPGSAAGAAGTAAAGPGSGARPAWRWSGEAGGVVCGQCDAEGRPVSPGTLESMRHLLAAEPRQAVQLRLGGAVASEMSELLAEYIGLRAPGRLKSLDFLESIR